MNYIALYFCVDAFHFYAKLKWKLAALVVIVIVGLILISIKNGCYTRSHAHIEPDILTIWIFASSITAFSLCTYEYKYTQHAEEYDPCDE